MIRCECTLHLKDGDKVITVEFKDEEAASDWVVKMAENSCFVHGGWEGFGIVKI